MTSPREEELEQRIRELERLVMVMAEKIALMAANLTMWAMKPDARKHEQRTTDKR